MRHRSPSIMAASIMVVACLSLLAVQLAGLHMHVNSHGYVGTPQRTHVHSVGPHNHDELPVDNRGIHSHEDDPTHDGDRDVSINEHGSATSKLKLVMLSAWLGLDRLMPLTPGEKILPYTVLPTPVGRHARWRPPLRAPPQLS